MIEPRKIAAAAIVVVALAIYFATLSHNEPTPAPQPPDGFSLRGKFVGPTAADDAAALAALCYELGDCLSEDSRKESPRIKTGAAIEDLRIAARDARMKGESIGARQPLVKAAVHQFLDDAAGTNGGVLTAEHKTAWVAAFRAVGRAAEDAAR